MAQQTEGDCKMKKSNTKLDIPAIEVGEECNPLLINKPPSSVSGLRAVETGVDPVTAALKIAPITVGNPAAAASLAIDQEHLEEYADPDAKSSIVECRRPIKGHFFTVRPEPEKPWKDRAFYFILELEGRDPYIVHPSIADKKKDEEDTIRPVMLVRYVTMGGEEGLWPVKLNPPDGRSNSWNTSALNILSLAEEGWVRMVVRRQGH
jgi:hypothetical protein